MWASKLIQEYKKGRTELRKKHSSLGEGDLDKLDAEQINSMIDSMTYSIEWLETGRQPDSYRGADRSDAYRVSQYEDMDIIPDITKELKREREHFYMDPKQRKALMKLFSHFSERERQCFIMYEAEKLTMQKIADRIGVSKSTVQSYLTRARQKIDELVGEKQ